MRGLHEDKKEKKEAQGASHRVEGGKHIIKTAATPRIYM